MERRDKARVLCKVCVLQEINKYREKNLRLSLLFIYKRCISFAKNVLLIGLDRKLYFQFFHEI